MRGASIRGLGALVVAIATAASCGWPEYAFEPSDDGDPEGGENSAGAGAPVGGSSGTAGAAGGRGGASGRGGAGGSPVPDACANSELDSGETDVDCGGDACPPCGPGSICGETMDCAERICTSHGICEFLFCGDGEANESETGMDCGGPDCERRCPEAAGCRTDSDCDVALVCRDASCTPDTCDPVLGSCGAADCRCANGRDCMGHDACASANCAAGTCGEGARVLSRNDEPLAGNSSTPAILVAFVIRNDAPSELPLGELSLRYFFSREDASEQAARCDESRAVEPNVCDGVTANLGEVMTAFVDTYVEVRLPTGTVLAPGARTNEFPIAVEATDGTPYNQSNDHSFSSNTDFALNANVTLYRSGVLVWGTEP